MKPVNETIPIAQLAPGDLWVRSLHDDDHTAVVLQVVKSEKQPKGHYHVTFDSNWRWAGEDSYTEALSADATIHVLRLLAMSE